jgi:hypothetical protein
VAGGDGGGEPMAPLPAPIGTPARRAVEPCRGPNSAVDSGNDVSLQPIQVSSYLAQLGSRINITHAATIKARATAPLRR